MMHRGVTAILVGLVCSIPAQADVVTFGTGTSEFEIEFVTVGNPGNGPDLTAFRDEEIGSVPYVFQMGKYEVSRGMILKANASAAIDGTGDLRIEVGPTNDVFHDLQQPASEINWEAAARFVNWLNSGSGFQHAYRFNRQPGDRGYGSPNSSAGDLVVAWKEGHAGFDPDNPFRNSLARYVLPSLDEWHNMPGRALSPEVSSRHNALMAVRRRWNRQ